MKILSILLICSLLYGCASMPIFFNRAEIGMTKEQLIEKGYTNPSLWSRKIIDGKTYETLYYHRFDETYDFVDNKLTGYCSKNIYHSANGTEDIKNPISTTAK
jgi:hypothetical protein